VNENTTQGRERLQSVQSVPALFHLSEQADHVLGKKVILCLPMFMK